MRPETSCPRCGQAAPPGVSRCPRDGAQLIRPSISTDTQPGVAAPRPHGDDTQSAVDPVLGLRLGEFEVTERLGEGGLSIVYAGTQPSLGRPVAIKVLKPELSGDGELVTRLQHEARLLAAMHHRNIVDVLSLGTLPDGRPYVVMEFLEGTSLHDWLQARGPMLPGDLIDMVDEILSALEAAHAAGVVHRDLKPTNVILVQQSDGTRLVKLLDFGLAKSTVPARRTFETAKHAIRGTPDYMAPEQVRGDPVGPPTDFYALGCVMFEMLTGRPPYQGNTPFDLLLKHLNSPIPLPSQQESVVPPEVDALVARLLAKRPEDRPASATLLRADLNALRDALHAASTHVIPTRAQKTSPSLPLDVERKASGFTPTPKAQPQPVRTPTRGLPVQQASGDTQPAFKRQSGVEAAAQTLDGTDSQEQVAATPISVTARSARPGVIPLTQEVTGPARAAYEPRIAPPRMVNTPPGGFAVPSPGDAPQRSWTWVWVLLIGVLVASGVGAVAALRAGNGRQAGGKNLQPARVVDDRSVGPPGAVVVSRRTQVERRLAALEQAEPPDSSRRAQLAALQRELDDAETDNDFLIVEQKLRGLEGR